MPQSDVEKPASVVNNNLEIPDTPEEQKELVELAPLVYKETRAGWRTTEFWITVVSALAVVFNGVPLPESKEGYVVALLAGLYAIARGLAKRGTPHVEPLE